MAEHHQPGAAIFSDADLVRMATIGAATLLDWHDTLGSLEPGKRADLIAIKSTASRYHQALVEATERDITLTMIGGIPVYGQPDLITPSAPAAEQLTVGGEPRLANFHTPGADPTVTAITLADATHTLTDALAHLPDLAAQHRPALVAEPAPRAEEAMTLALDEIEQTGLALRINPPGGFHPPAAALQTPLTGVLVPLELDPLTVVDDADFLTTLAGEQNLPASLPPALAKAYGTN